MPRPTAPPGGVLVRTTHSVISLGTERMKVEQARMNLLQKARARPDQVRKVLDTARTLGWRAALEKVWNRLETPTPLGYSAAGIVEEVDSANTRLRAGDRVACGGAECAFHAEYVAVPDMLVAKVPDGVENWQAAYTAIVSIALQTVRQLEPTLGERVLVTGQGLVGLLVTALLRSNGVRVLAMDLAPARQALAEAMGAERFLVCGHRPITDEVRAWTEGYGVDAVVLATTTQSNTPTEQAVEALRDRGRLIVVGNTKVELPWKQAYEKEIELRYTRGYGPGRYDLAYEWAGADYPIGYVRWTEQRNFEASLHLMKTGPLDLAAITTRRVAFAESLAAYAELLANDTQVGVVLQYETRPQPREPGPTVQVQSADLKAGGASLDSARPSGIAKLSKPVGRLDVIGAGNFARTMLLPHLQGLVAVGTVVNHTSLSANHVKTKFGFAQAATDPAVLFGASAPAVPGAAPAAAAAVPTAGSSAVMIATRNHLHAPLVVEALAANRHVFVEKPL